MTSKFLRSRSRPHCAAVSVQLAVAAPVAVPAAASFSSGVAPSSCRPSRRTFPALAWMLAAVLAGIVTPASATPEKAAAFYENALQRFEKDDLKGAIVQLKNSIQADNKLLAAHMLLGRALLRNGNLKGAEAAFEEALNQGMNRGEAALALGRIYIITGNADKVIERFTPAGLPPALQARVLTLRANAYVEMGNTVLATREFEAARAADPASAAPWIDEIPLLLSARQKDRARAAAAKALELAPENAAAWNMHASVLQDGLDMQGALAAYSKALALDPKHVDARVARAGLLADLKRDTEAGKDLAALSGLAADDPRAAYLRAILASRKGDQAVAARELGNMVNTLDGLPRELLNRREQLMLLAALGHNALGNWEKSRRYLESIIVRNANHIPARKLLASAYIRVKDYRQAEPHLLMLQTAAPDDPQVLFMLGSWELSRRKFARATELLDRAALKLDDLDVNRALAVSQFGQGREELGQATLEKAYASSRGDAELGTTLAMRHLRRGQPAKALQIAEEMVKRDPANLTVLNFQGAVKSGSGDFAGARKAFVQVLAADPAFRPAILNLARLDAGERKFDDARARLTQFLSRAPDDADALFDLGMMEQRAGRAAEAMRHLKKAAALPRPDTRTGLALLELQLAQRLPDDAIETAKALSSKFPDSLPVQLALGRTYLATGNPANARSILQTATKNAAFDPRLQVEIGRLQLASGNPDGAHYNVQKALQGEADHLGALALSVDVELQRKDLPRAEAAARTLAAKHPNRAEAPLASAQIALVRGQYPAAVNAFRAALTKQESTLIALGLVQAHIAAGEAPKAAAFLEGWVKAKPGDQIALKALAETQYRAGQLQAARQTYVRVVARQPDDAQTLNNYANLLQQLGDPAAAEMAEKAVKLVPGDANYADTLGWILVQQGKIEAGLRQLREARLRNPGNAEIRYHLAFALAKMGRKAEAREELQAALGLQAQLAASDEVKRLKQEIAN